MGNYRTNFNGKRLLFTAFIVLISTCVYSQQTHIEPIPFGDFEQWTTRNLKESSILGGKEKKIYNIGPAEYLLADGEKYDYCRTIWCSSNVNAYISGISKISCTVRPEQGYDDLCARLETVLERCKVIGIVNVKALTDGLICFGACQEPLTSLDEPYRFYDWGIPFTRKPKNLILDFKALINPDSVITVATGFNFSTYKGNSAAEIRVLLQNRTEDENGNIYAKRVGTGVYRIENSTSDWQKSFRVPIFYGDIRHNENYQEYMNLTSNEKPFYAQNSKGEIVKIHENAWAGADDKVTHVILLIASGCKGVYQGEVGNVLWVDNLKFEY